MAYTYTVGQKVRFTKEALETGHFGHGDQEHTIVSTEVVPDTKKFDGVDKISSIQAAVGHHQWLVLENGEMYSAKLLELAN